MLSRQCCVRVYQIEILLFKEILKLNSFNNTIDTINIMFIKYSKISNTYVLHKNLINKYVKYYFPFMTNNIQLFIIILFLSFNIYRSYFVYMVVILTVDTHYLKKSGLEIFFSTYHEAITILVVLYIDNNCIQLSKNFFPKKFIIFQKISVYQHHLLYTS